jgi:hypothetical protein
MREIDPFSFFTTMLARLEAWVARPAHPILATAFTHPMWMCAPGRPILNSNSLGSKIRRDLSLRVHAFRPESGENASLAAAGRINVATDDMRDLVVRVRFGALRDVKYAFMDISLRMAKYSLRILKFFLMSQRMRHRFT